MDVSKEFESIVESAKEQEMKVLRANEEIKELKKTLNEVEKTSIIRDTDIVKLKSNKSKEGRTIEDMETHANRTRALPSITVTKATGKFMGKVHYINPETGRDATMGRTRDTLPEAVIARNEIAATLLREGLIDFEQFLRVTNNF